MRRTWGKVVAALVALGMSGMAAADLPATCVTGTKEDFFKDYANGNYVPRAYSPLMDKGSSDVTELGTDLANGKRVAGQRIDIGAYEGPAAGSMIFLR